jgi:hypothetical protein
MGKLNQITNQNFVVPPVRRPSGANMLSLQIGTVCGTKPQLKMQTQEYPPAKPDQSSEDR